MAVTFVDQLPEDTFTDKKVLARFDFNVPLDGEDKSKISDTTRIDSALETIRLILAQKPKKLILMSHLGRPKGQANPDFSLEPVATYLAEKLDEEVLLTESCKDRGIKTLLELSQNRVLLLQNLRFHSEETDNDHEFSKTLASYGDFYVNDAFGTAHRKHASTYGVNTFFNKRAYGGLLLKKEITALEKIVQKPTSPFVAIVGGAKVSDKIKIIERLLVNVNQLLIGGAMAYPFLKAQGHNVGTSLCEESDVQLAAKILSSKGAQKIVLPSDHIASETFAGAPLQVNSVDLSEGIMGLDIGEQTLAQFSHIIKNAKTVLWNGPMGLFENVAYSKGTFGIAEALTKVDGFTLVGGGDSVSAVVKSGLADKMGHVSTGGGASLEYIENGTLPGIQALKFGIQ
ncbi:MAG: phosphoglycerate kinase [Halobacteriovoraceae bacterium]|jgi:phosphoglycerate kinase|nr:phosphoglycerate kinase [Halobacteriovoraceae bacterium]MBT5093745.1 phosphoglycerate kinase [Halobacteriovoraceae bacterium]